MHRNRVIAVLIVTASFVVACSSSPDDAAPDTPTTLIDAVDSIPATQSEASTNGTTTVSVSATDTIPPADPTSTPAAPSSTEEPGAPPPDVGIASCWEATSDDSAVGSVVSFAEVTSDVGLLDPLTGMHGHATAAGDPNGDGWTDLFVGGFADRDRSVYAVRGATGPSPDRLLLGGPDGFEVDPTFPDDRARSSGAVFADLDGDGDDDLVVARNRRGDDGIAGRPTVVLENTGDGWNERVDLAPGVAARAVAAVDVDRDGILDLVIGGDRWGDSATEVHRGLGAFVFEDVTDAWGVPSDYTGLALATVDVDGDGWLDIVMNGDPRILRGGASGFTPVEVPDLRWEPIGDEDDPAGLAVGDLDGDDRPDLVLGHHFNSTLDLGARVPVRLLLNRSEPDAVRFVDVTAAAGSPDLWTKSPHVALTDLDNDGLNDVITSAVTASGAPLVLRQIPSEDGPRFEVVGDEGSGQYWVTGVADDLDRDGRVDAFFVEWEPTAASVLARNTTTGGSWLELDLAALPGATGRRVSVTDPATGRVLARAWPASTTGYAAGSSSVLHFGLGDAPASVVVTVATESGDVTASLTVDARYRVGGCVG